MYHSVFCIASWGWSVLEVDVCSVHWFTGVDEEYHRTAKDELLFGRERRFDWCIRFCGGLCWMDSQVFCSREICDVGVIVVF